MGVRIRGSRGTAGIRRRPEPAARGRHRDCAVWDRLRVPGTESRSPRAATAPPAAPGSLQVPLWRAIAVIRVASLAYVTVLVVRNVGTYARPMLVWPVLTDVAA